MLKAAHSYQATQFLFPILIMICLPMFKSQTAEQLHNMSRTRSEHSKVLFNGNITRRILSAIDLVDCLENLKMVINTDLDAHNNQGSIKYHNYLFHEQGIVAVESNTNVQDRFRFSSRTLRHLQLSMSRLNSFMSYILDASNLKSTQKFENG